MARRRRDLTPDEQELWSRIARTTDTTYAKTTPAPVAPATRLPASLKQSPAMPDAVPTFRIGQAATGGRPLHDPSPSPAQRLSQSPLRMDHKTHKRMTQGKLRPEARLDLHGMTLAAAHPELIAFILSCRANGHRLVLVITGKGRGDHGPLPTRPGALRHQVPFWLHQPPLSAAVQQVTAAHYRHGGEGAYYVYLRR